MIPYRHGGTKVLLVALAAALTAFFFPPASIYFSNVLEYQCAFGSMAPLLAAATALCVLAVTALLFGASRPMNALLVHHAYRRLIALLLAVTLLLWLKGNFFVWDHGVLDGSEIDWTRYARRGWVEIALWATFLVLAFVKSRVLDRHARTIALFLIVVQAASLGIAVTKAPSAPKRFQIEKKDRYVFGNRNVIVLVLDTFQGDVFNELAAKDPRYASLFDGFTYMRDAAGGHVSTFPSVTLFLTGKIFSNEMPIRKHIDAAFLSPSSLPLRLKEEGFTVHLFPNRRSEVNCDPRVASNIVEKKPASKDVRADVTRLYVVGALRYFPHVIQRALFDGREELGITGKFLESKVPGQSSWDDLVFSKEVVEKSRVEPGAPMFKYLHLWGCHRPWILTRDLTSREERSTREGYKDHAMGALRVTEIFLERLKKLGIYDSSMIFVMGDHGAHMPVDVPKEFGGNTPPVAGGVYPNLKGAGVPVILVKPFGARGPMKISDAPVSLMDVPVTIAAALKLDGDFPGIPMFENHAPKNRKRPFYAYRWDLAMLDQDYLPGMTRWEISGFSWLDSSWTQLPFDRSKSE